MVLPDTARIANALRQFKTERQQMAIGIEPAADGSLTLPGTFPIHDLVDLGVNIEPPETGDYTTVAGIVLMRLGRIPDIPGDIVELEGWSIEVLEVDHHAVRRVRMRPTLG